MNTLFQKTITHLDSYHYLILPLRRLTLLVVVGLLLFIAQAQAATTTIFHNFGDGSVSNDGTGPVTTLLLGTDGNYYGVTNDGGSANEGTVYKITPTGTVTILHNFEDGTITNDGRAPQSDLVQDSSGNFYGTTASGGGFLDAGTIFKITSAGSVTILHRFGGGSSDGAIPLAGLVQGTDSNLYGMTYSAGSSNDGTIFKITPSGTFTLLHSFSGTTNDGNFPDAALIQATDGQFYGTTAEGGSTNKGTAFKVTSTGTFTFLHSFGTVTNDAKSPEAPLVQAADGNFYGTTESGGSGGNAGTAFKMTSAGSVTILHVFGSITKDGLDPEAGLIQIAGGDFFGTTLYGGTGTGSAGTVFEMTPAGTVTILHNFDDGSVTNDGKSPIAKLIQGPDGGLYSSTLDGGSANKGTLFKVSTYTVLHRFNDGSVTNDGSEPNFGALLKATDGNYYGTTLTGGSAGQGAVFKMTPAGSITILHSFGSVTGDGGNPQGGLIQGTDGNLYGTASAGGSGGGGTAFKITATGTFTLLHAFDDGSVSNDGEVPYGTLALGTDGNYYGTTAFGGSGTVFKITPAGSETVLYHFQGGSDGNAPFDGLVRGTDGNFYGTTNGLDLTYGAIFKITPSGTLTVLHSFTFSTTDGSYPYSNLVQDSSGNFWGTTSGGGSSGNGTVFKITPTGTFTIVHSFGDGSVANDGTLPAAGLIQDAQGNFYGTTPGGGSANDGAVFKITPSGVETILHSFGDGTVSNDGLSSTAPLVFGPDGYLYGTTQTTGTQNYTSGAVFKLLP